MNRRASRDRATISIFQTHCMASHTGIAFAQLNIQLNPCVNEILTNLGLLAFRNVARMESSCIKTNFCLHVVALNRSHMNHKPNVLIAAATGLSLPLLLKPTF